MIVVMSSRRYKDADGQSITFPQIAEAKVPFGQEVDGSLESTVNATYRDSPGEVSMTILIGV